MTWVDCGFASLHESDEKRKETISDDRERKRTIEKEKRQRETREKENSEAQNTTWVIKIKVLKE